MPFKFRVVFSKKGLMRFISHLDLMRLFSRALRRTQLSLYYTRGFNPHPKLSFKRALKLGVESENEEMTIYLKENISLEEIKNKLNNELPDGIQIKGVECLTKS